MLLKDPFNRPISNIRISLTPKCNLNCIYCHREGELNPKAELSQEEIAEILRVAAKFEIRSVKFTGGEPLMKRVNVSLDSINRETYKKITGSDKLDDVLAGMEAALDAGLTPIKINMVVLEGINDHEIDDFLSYIRGNRNLVLQLIELMDFNACDHHSKLDGLEDSLAARSKQIITRRMHHRKKYCLDGAEVEVVRPRHNSEFCAFCNRLRVTSDGKLKPCLLRTDNHVDIRGKSGGELEELFQKAVALREPFYK